MSVVVVATNTPKPEHRFDVITALKDAINQVHDEVLKGKLEGPLDIVVLDPVPAGEHAKGQLL